MKVVPQGQNGSSLTAKALLPTADVVVNFNCKTSASCSMIGVQCTSQVPRGDRLAVLLTNNFSCDAAFAFGNAGQHRCLDH